MDQETKREILSKNKSTTWTKKKHRSAWNYCTVCHITAAGNQNQLAADMSRRK